MTHTAASSARSPMRTGCAHGQAWLACFLQGCSTPMDVRKDAEFQSYATQSTARWYARRALSLVFPPH